jgi:hypothetical protein
MLLHTTEFAQRWRGLLQAVYGYRCEGPWVAVPDLFGRTTLSQLPLLNYSDLTPTQAQAALPSAQGQAFQVRCLDETVNEFAPDAPVTMRVNMSGLSPEQVFAQRVTSKCRNQIRKAQKSPLRLVAGTDAALIQDFYRLFQRTMHRYGTPVFTRRLFEALPQHVNTRFCVAYLGDEPVAGLCLVMDGALAWVPWAASEPAHKAHCPNHLIYWDSMAHAVQQGCEVFDFGRSPHGGATFAFKSDWGAQPVAIVFFSSQTADVYSKYGLASTIWKKLPLWLTNRLGPVLCRRLVDL